MEDVGKFWDSVSDYNDVNQKTYSYMRRFTDGYALSSLKDDSYILDICARTGLGSLFFAKKGKIRKTVCADVSSNFQKICKYLLSKNNISHENILFHDFPLPLPDKEFDAILCFETIEHFSKHHVFLEELLRVLKPGGQMVLTTPNVLWEPVHSLAFIFDIHHSEGPHRFLRRKKLIQLLKDTGFNITKEKSTVFIPGGPCWLTEFGEKIEKSLNERIFRFFALRRIFICRKE